MEIFGVATVMNICVFKLKDGEIYKHNEALSFDSFWHACEAKKEEGAESKLLFLDTLKISNLSESGPQKTFKAGKINIPIIRHGKQTTLNINDALGRLQTLVHFFGLKPIEGFAACYGTEEFVEPLALEGEMKIVNLKGETETLYLFIPCFLPDGKLTLTQDAEGAFGVFDLSGQLFPMKMKKIDENNNSKEIYSKYIIGKHPFISAYEQTVASYIYEFNKVAAVPPDLTTYDDSIIYNEDSVAVESTFEEN